MSIPTFSRVVGRPSDEMLRESQREIEANPPRVIKPGGATAKHRKAVIEALPTKVCGDQVLETVEVIHENLTEWLTEARIAKTSMAGITTVFFDGLWRELVLGVEGEVPSRSVIVNHIITINALKESKPIPKDLAAFFEHTPESLLQALLDNPKGVILGNPSEISMGTRADPTAADLAELVGLWDSTVESDGDLVAVSNIGIDRPEPREYGPDVNNIIATKN